MTRDWSQLSDLTVTVAKQMLKKRFATFVVSWSVVKTLR